MDFEPVDIAVPEERPVVNLQDGVPLNVYSEERSSEHAKRAMTVAPDMDPEERDRMARSGDDSQIRDRLASEEQLRQNQLRLENITNVIASGGSQEAVQTARALAEYQPTRPSTHALLERSYGAAITNQVAAVTEMPDTAENDLLLDALENTIAQNEVVKDTVDLLNQEWDEMSFAGKAYDFAFTMLPFLTWYQRNKAIENAPHSKLLPGSNTKEQMAYLRNLPVEQFKTEFQKAVQDIRDTVGILEAQTFAAAALGYSDSDAFFDNIAIGGADIATLPAIKIGKAMLKGTAKATSKPRVEAAKVADSVGQTREAATEYVAKNPEVLTQGETATEKYFEHAPTYMNVEGILAGETNLSARAVSNLMEQQKARIAKGEAILTDANGIDRVSQEELKVLAEEAFDEIKGLSKPISNAVIDADVIPGEDNLFNVNVAVVRLGTQNGELFKTQRGAENFAKKVAQLTDDYEVKVTADNAWYIEVQKNIKETETLNNVALETSAQTPRVSLSWLWSEGDLVSPQARTDRRVVTSQAEQIGVLAEELAAPIRSLGSKEIRKLEGVLEQMRDTVIKGERGVWDTLPEFEHRYRTLHGEWPSVDDVDAYMAYRTLNDTEYLLRDFNLYKEKARMGYESITIGDTAFEGVVRKEIPWGSKNFFRLHVLDENGKVTKRASGLSKGKTQDDINKMLDEGYVLVQVANANLEGAAFVMAKAPKRSKIGLKNIEYRPGGHVITKSPWFIKQGKVTSSQSARFYNGDTTILNAATQKEAVEQAKLLNEAMRLHNNAPRAELRKFIDDNMAGFTDYDTFLKEIKKGRLNPDVPFSVTRSGRRTIDNPEYKSMNLTDGTRGAYNMDKFLSGRFVGHRDAQTVDTVVSEGDSVFRQDKAQLIRPMEALQIGVRNATNQRVMNDYILKSTDRYLREFKDILNIPESELRTNPLWYVANAERKDFLEGADPDAVKTAMTLSQAIRNIIGTPTEASIKLENMKQKMLNYAFEKGGAKLHAKAEVLAERLIPIAKDPSAALRGVAFDTKLGLFNPKQIFLQANILTNVVALEGRASWSGMRAYTMSYGMRMNRSPAMRKEIAKRMKSQGWKEEHYLEAADHFENSGWAKVGGDVAYRDAYEGADLVGGTIGNVREKGRYFFNKGEQFGRGVGYFAAYRNWRLANPNAKFDRAAKNAILERATLTTANMTRDMNSWWQRGFKSLPTQFLGFQWRTFELLWGKRLTRAEKARLGGAFSLMYGMPVGIGAATFAWPVNETAKKWAKEWGIEDEIEGNMALETLRDGLYATALEMGSSAFLDEPIDLDTANFGPAGIPNIKEFVQNLQGDPYGKDLVELLLGPAGQITKEIVFDGAVPLAKGIYYGVRRDPQGQDMYPVTLDSLWNATQSVSSASNARKLFLALSTQQYISRNGTYLGDVSSTQEAVLSSILGLQPEKLSDIFIDLEILGEAKILRKDLQFEAARAYKRARVALQQGDMKQHNIYMVQAKSFLEAGRAAGMTPREERQAYDRGFDYNSLEDSTKERYEKYLLQLEANRIGRE